MSQRSQQTQQGKSFFSSANNIITNYPGASLPYRSNVFSQNRLTANAAPEQKNELRRGRTGGMGAEGLPRRCSGLSNLLYGDNQYRFFYSPFVIPRRRSSSHGLQNLRFFSKAINSTSFFPVAKNLRTAEAHRSAISIPLPYS